MEEIKLSKRLQKIVGHVPSGKIIVDIGSDHGLLVSYLVKNGISLFAIAGEINDGPFQATINQTSNFNLKDKIAVRKGNGLEVIQEDVDVIIIAGMGGTLITEILENGKEKLKNVERLILQPNVREENIRKWLDDNDWNIIDEEILRENQKIYEIIIAERKKCCEDSVYKYRFNDLFPMNKEDLYKVGPILFYKRDKILIEKWKLELKKLEYILKELDKSSGDIEQNIRKKEINSRYEWVKELVRCLQEDNTLYKYSSN